MRVHAMALYTMALYVFLVETRHAMYHCCPLSYAPRSPAGRFLCFLLALGCASLRSAVRFGAFATATGSLPREVSAFFATPKFVQNRPRPTSVGSGRGRSAFLPFETGCGAKLLPSSAVVCGWMQRGPASAALDPPRLELFVFPPSALERALAGARAPIPAPPAPVICLSPRQAWLLRRARGESEPAGPDLIAGSRKYRGFFWPRPDGADCVELPARPDWPVVVKWNPWPDPAHRPDSVDSPEPAWSGARTSRG